MKAGMCRPYRHLMDMVRSDKIHRLDSSTCFDLQQNQKVISARRGYCIFHSYAFGLLWFFPKIPSHVRIYYTCTRISALLNLLCYLTQYLNYSPNMMSLTAISIYRADSISSMHKPNNITICGILPTRMKTEIYFAGQILRLRYASLRMTRKLNVISLSCQLFDWSRIRFFTFWLGRFNAP
jgi:hypothetical protein